MKSLKFILVITLLFSAFSVFADYSYTDDTSTGTYDSAGDSQANIFFKGDTLGGEHIETFKLYGSAPTTNGVEDYYRIIRVHEFPDATTMNANSADLTYEIYDDTENGNVGYSSVGSVSATPSELEFVVPSTLSALSFDPDKYYRIDIQGRTGGANRINFKGSSVTNPDITAVSNQEGVSGTITAGDFTSGVNPYMIVTTTGDTYGGDPSETPSSFTINSPSDGALNYDGDMEIDFDFHYNGSGGYNVVGYGLTNISLGIEYPTTEQDLIAIGAGSYTDSLSGLADGIYQFYPYMRSTTTPSSVFNGLGRYFTIGTTTASSLFIEPENIATGTIPSLISFLLTPSPSALNAFQQIQVDLAGRFPFAYLFDFKETLTILYTGDSTESFDFTLPFGDIGEITIISQEQIANAPFASTLKTLTGYALWIMFFFGIFHRVKRIFDSNAGVTQTTN